MSADPRGDVAARGAALRGAVVGLLLAAALLGPAFVAGEVPARGDLADFFWPMKAYTAERWAAGGVPLWNPLSGAGEPWLAQLQTGALYPGDLPFLLGWREGAFLGIAFHLALAAAGAAYWLWSLGSSRPAALVAGGLYAGGGAFLSLVPVYNNACTAAWLPWVFAGARRAVTGRSRGAGFAVAVAGAFLAGEPALAAAGSLAAVALALFAGTEGEAPETADTPGRLRARVLLPLLAGTALAGAALVPFGELIANAGRRERTTRQEAVAQPVGLSDLADLVAPPRPESTRVPTDDRGGYLATLALGPLPLLLAAGVGAGFPGRRRFVAGLAALAAGSLLLALGEKGLLAPLLFDAGPLRGIRFPARWVVFTHLGLAIAAGAGLDGWMWGRFGRPEGTSGKADGAEEREGAARRNVAVGALAAGLLLLAALAALAGLGEDSRAGRDPARTLAGAVAAIAGVVTVAVARRRPGGARPGAAAVLAAAALVPLPYLAGEPLAAVPASAVAAEPATLAGVDRGPETGRVFAPAGQDRTLALRWRYSESASWGPGPVSRAAAALAGYTNLFHGVATAGSASPVGDPRGERLLGAALAGGNPARLLSLLDVRHVVTPFPARLPGLRLAAQASGVRRYDTTGASGRSFFPLESRAADDDSAFAELLRPEFDPGRLALVAPPPGGTPLPPPRARGSWAMARFLSDGPERSELATSASAPSLLVFTRTWDRGWRATVDGAPVPVLRAHLALQAVVVPAGEHRLELAYRPASFRIGLGLSAAGLLGVLALALAAPPGARRR